MDLADITGLLENMTPGSLLYYGGLLGAGVSGFLLLLCTAVFPIRRKRLLKKLGKE